MNDGLIPGRYAKALYKVACANGDAEMIYDQLKRLNLSYATVEELTKVVRNPYIPARKRSDVLIAATGAKMGSSLHDFINLVIENNRTDYLHNIALAYLKLYRQEHNIAKVEIETASRLPQEKIDSIIEVVKKELGDVTLEISHEVNENLIGGFCVRVDSILLDASVRNELQKLRLKLLS